MRRRLDNQFADAPDSGVVDIEIRRASAADHPAIIELDGASFGISYGPEDAADAALVAAPEQFLLAEDAGRIVGASAELDLAMAVPGGRDVSAAGITWVSVDVTHRRRGILRALIEQQLREERARGYAVSALNAAQSGIYGRFGYGMASQFRTVVIDRPQARLATTADASMVRRLTSADAAQVLPAIFDRWRATTPGAVSRPADRWRYLLLDRPSQRGQMGALQHLVHPDGYLSYRLGQDWSVGDPRFVCKIVDYAPVTARAHAALWQIVLSMDLVGRIESDMIPMDDPLPWLLTDSRQVRTTMVRDGLYLRPLDVPGLLAQRRYDVPVDTVLAVADPLFGDGRYRLQAGPDGATCVPTDRSADIELSVANLGAVALGGSRLAALARAGLVESGDERRVAALDRALLADRAPAHATFI